MAVDTLRRVSTAGRPTESPATVVAVEVDRQRAVTVEYDDGLVAEFGLLDLRRACPCAGCQGRREQGRAAYEGESITVVDAELHGNWALSVRWSDGHDTGMFAWSYLRALAEPDTEPGDEA